MKLAQLLTLIGASMLGAAPAPSQAIPSPGRIIPMFAAGGSWELELQVFNLTNQAREFEIQFSNDDGPLILPLWSESEFLGNHSGVIGQTVPANGLRIFRSPADGVEGNLKVGYVGVGSLPDHNAVAAWAVLTQKVPDRPDFQLAIPKLATAEKQRLPFRNSPPFTSSLAIVTSAAEIRLVAYAGSGELLCSVVYPASGHQAFLLEDVAPCTSGTDGTIEVRAIGDGPDQATVVGITANDFGAFTVQLPIQVP